MRNITVNILPQKKRKTSQRQWWQRRYVWVPAATLLGLILIIGAVAAWRVPPMIAAAKSVSQQVDVLKAAAKQQDMAALDSGLPELQTRLNTLQSQTAWLSFAQPIPFLGSYYQDSQHIFAGAKEGLTGGEILVKGVEPYSDVLGFKGATNEPKKPTEERIAELTLLMPSLLPSLDEAQGHFDKLKAEMDQVDPSRYPRKLGSMDIRQTLTDVKSGVDSLETGMQQARPLLSILPSVMGTPDSKKYLILFQNDKELRPTGGFLTSYAYVTFTKGAFTISDTGDIYQLDNNKAYLPLPAPIRTYLSVPQWNMRDTNFSPDFAKSMEDFQYYYTRNTKLAPIDGIIALDTQFVEGLMEMTGPLTVPGYKEPFSAQPVNINGTTVPQVVYQLELISEKSGGGSQRKGILGDLMQAIIKKTLSEPASRWPDYLSMLVKEGQQKHILMNFHDTKAQQLAEDRNFAGRIVAAGEGQDYLHVNDANLAGLKSNLYLKQQTKQQVTIDSDGTVHEKLTITYTNTGKFDGWLNANAHNYLRVYVPQGSKLTRSSGGDQKTTTSTDLGKTVFDNFVLVHPLQSRTVTMEYTLPFKVTGNYSELIQKQPGAQNWNYEVLVNGQSQKIVIDGDKTITSKK